MSDENTTRPTVDAGEHRDEAAELPTLTAAVVEPAAAEAAVVETIAVDAMLNEGAPAVVANDQDAGEETIQPVEQAQAIEASVMSTLSADALATVVAEHALFVGVIVPVKASSGYCSSDLHLQPGDARTLADIAAGLTASGKPTATAGEALHAVLEQIRQLTKA